MDKSFVTMEQEVCICCNKKFDTGSLLLDKRMRPRFDMHTTTGLGVCGKCKKEGFILMIACDPEKSTETNGHIKPENAYRTGATCQIKKEAFDKIFNTPYPKGEVVFCDEEVINRLAEMQPK